MKTYIALLRGINVGGRNVLPMKELVALLDELGCKNIKTYVQSGNAVLQSPIHDASELSGRIGREIKRRRSFEPHVLLLGEVEFARIVETNPFPEAESDPGSLHVGFLDSVPKRPDMKKLENLKADSERFQLTGQAFYLHAPDGVGRSKLAAKCEKLLGVPMTDRNWRTVGRIMAMLKELDK